MKERKGNISGKNSDGAMLLRSKVENVEKRYLKCYVILGVPHWTHPGQRRCQEAHAVRQALSQGTQDRLHVCGIREGVRRSRDYVSTALGQ